MPSRTLINGVATVPIINQHYGTIMTNGVGIGGIQTDKKLYLPGYIMPDGKLMDRSGNNNHGTISGATLVRLPSGLTALNFDGNDRVIVTANASLNPGNNSFTAIVWANYSSIGGVGEFVGALFCYYVDSSNGWVIPFRNTNWPLSLRIFVAGSNIATAPRFTPTINTWYQFVGVRDKTAGKLYFYKNGAVYGSVDDALGAISNGGTLYIGWENQPSYHLGLINLNRYIIGTAWTASQILSSYQQEKSYFGV